MKRHPFNLVEIALATAVLGVGVASVLALFPVGATTSRSAVAENSIADVAEFFFGYFQTQYQAGWNAAGTRSGFAADTGCPNFSSLPKPLGKDSNFRSTPMTGFPNLYDYNGNSGLYIYRQGDDTSGVDFEAMVRVGRVANNANAVHYPGIGSASGGVASGYSQSSATGYTSQLFGSSTVPKYLTSLLIEFSWPIDAPWDEREKRVYRLDVFNEQFEPYTPTASP